MPFKVRPFKRFFEIPSEPAVALRGSINSAKFVLSLDFADYSLSTVEVRDDSLGAYALVEEGEFSYQHGATVNVAPYAQGCEITVSWINLTGSERKHIRATLSRSSIDEQSSAIVIRGLFAERALSFYFDDKGRITGVVWSSPTGPRSITRH